MKVSLLLLSPSTELPTPLATNVNGFCMSLLRYFKQAQINMYICPPPSVDTNGGIMHSSESWFVH